MKKLGKINESGDETDASHYQTESGSLRLDLVGGAFCFEDTQASPG